MSLLATFSRFYSNASSSHLESRGDVGEVGDSSTDDEHFPVGVFRARHQRQDGAGVIVRLLLAGRTAVFAVVGELACASKLTDGVAVERWW